MSAELNPEKFKEGSLPENKNSGLFRSPEGRVLPADNKVKEEQARLEGGPLKNDGFKTVEEVPDSSPNPEEALIADEEKNREDTEKLEANAETIKYLNENQKTEILGGTSTRKDGYGAQGWQTNDGGFSGKPELEDNKPDEGLMAKIRNWLRPGGEAK